MRRDVFQAIADPTRRQIMDLLTAEPMNLNAIAENFDVSRPAISKHIRILEECGLVQVEQLGRERFCKAVWLPLKEVSDWAVQYQKFWNTKLDALGAFLEKSNKKRHHKAKVKG